MVLLRYIRYVILTLRYFQPDSIFSMSLQVNCNLAANLA
jgi:hypothetical protein